MADTRGNVEEQLRQFRSALTDAVRLAEKLLPFCKTTEELVQVAGLALENDAQMLLLLHTIEAPQGRK